MSHLFCRKAISFAVRFTSKVFTDKALKMIPKSLFRKYILASILHYTIAIAIMSSENEHSPLNLVTSISEVLMYRSESVNCETHAQFRLATGKAVILTEC